MSEGIEIEVMGHKGKITRLLPTISPFPRIIDEERDLIDAWVEFDPPVDGTMGMYVHLPARAYTRDELIAAVVKRAETHFEVDRGVKEMRAKREAREKALEALVEGVRKAVGL